MKDLMTPAQARIIADRMRLSYGMMVGAAHAATDALGRLGAALEKLDQPKPIEHHPTMTRLLAKMTRRYPVRGTEFLRAL